MKSLVFLALGAAIAYAYIWVNNDWSRFSTPISAVGHADEASSIDASSTVPSVQAGILSGDGGSPAPSANSPGAASAPAPAPATAPAPRRKEDSQPDMIAQAQQQDIKDQIKRLQDDVNAQYGRLLEHVDAQDRINDDKAKIADLQKQLDQ